MSRGGRRYLGRWSAFVIALAIAGTGLDALPAILLAEVPACEASSNDDGLDEVENGVDLASPPLHVRRGAARPARGGALLDHFASPASRRAPTRAAAVGRPP